MFENKSTHRFTRTFYGITTFLLFIASCSNYPVGELSGIVQLEKSTNSEGILIFLPGTQFRAFTDSNGSFLITGIPSGQYTMVAQFAGYEDQREEIHIETGQQTSVGPFLLSKPYKPHGSLSGFIALDGQTTHENIMVMLVGTSYTANTNTTGFFQINNIPPGNYQLLALKEHWLPATRNNIQIKDNEETQIEKIILKQTDIEPTPTPISWDLGDHILQGYAFLEGENNHSDIRITLVDIPGKETVTDSSGAFVIKGLDEEPHTLFMSYPGYLDETIPNAVPVSASSTRTCGFITLQKEYQPGALGVLQGQVLLEGKEEHGNSTVQLEGISPPVWTDSQGRYKFVGVPAKDYTLVADHPGYAKGRLEKVAVIANQITQAPILILSATNSLNQNGTGEIVGMAMLAGEDDQGGILIAVEGTSFTAVTGPTGQFTFNAVPVGAYTLIFSKGGFKNYYLEGVPVQEGETTALEPVLLQKDVDPPYVIDTFPRNGARRIPIFQFIDLLVRFSERMDGESVKRALLIDPPAAFDAFFDRESELSDLDTLHVRLYHDPAFPLAFQTRYRIVITPQARTPKGISLQEAFAFNFTTDGPLIIDSVPRKGDPQFVLQIAQQLMIMTNAPIDQRLFERSVRFRPEPDSRPIYHFYPEGLGTRVMIETTLRPDTRYRMQISNALKTIDGQRFSNTPFTLVFRTTELPDFDQAPNPRRSSRRHR